MKRESETNREYATKLAELMLANPSMGVLVLMESESVSYDYTWTAGNLTREPEIEAIAVNHENEIITRDGDDYEDCVNYYGYDADEWTDEEIKEKAKQIPWENTIVFYVSGY